jgi:hypothetical protein
MENDRTDLATETASGWSRSTLARHASGMNGSSGCWALAPSGANCRTDTHRTRRAIAGFQQWVRKDKLEWILLDAGDRALRSLMTQTEQVVNVHMGEAILDGKKPEALKVEALKVEAIRTNGESTVPGGKFLP